MFILTPIAINSPLTYKRAHVCIPTVIAASLAISCDSSSFSSYCSDRISKRQREGEEIEASICIASCNSFFSLHEHYFSNPNGGEVRK